MSETESSRTTTAPTKEKSSLSLLQHRGLLNFRDLGLSSGDNPEGKRYIKEGLIFRSATLDNLNEQEVEKFVQEHNIRTIVDLRTRREGSDGSAIDKNFPTSVLEQIKPTHLLPAAAAAAAAATGGDTTPTVTEERNVLTRKKYRIAFTGKNFERNGIFMSCTLRQKFLLVMFLLFCQRHKAAALIGREVLSPMGISNMYQKLVTYCQEELLQTLLIFTNPENYPIHVHCTQGKDRTGLVSCLLLSMAGAPEEVIVRDYAKTQAGLAPIRNEMLQDLRRVGLSDEFADAPPQNMRGLLEYVRSSYGSVQDYLSSIGFDEKHQERVRTIICQQQS